MQTQDGTGRFDQAVSGLSRELAGWLLDIDAGEKAKITEIRLRAGKPVMIVAPGSIRFLGQGSRLQEGPQQAYIAPGKAIEQSLASLSAYSLHSHQDELKNGFLTLQGGHRAGICGTAVLEQGRVTAVRDVNAINLRIARDIARAAEQVIQRAFPKGLEGLLLVGPPASGKTTVLRDLARQLANGRLGGYKKVAVIDERGELGAVYNGVPQNDLGVGCDILHGYPKNEGILTAIRTLSPDVVICDEIGSGEEAQQMLDGIHCGVTMIATAHGRTREDISRKPSLARLLEEGAFAHVAFLGEAGRPGCVGEIWKAGDLLGKAYGDAAGAGRLYPNGDVSGSRVGQTGGQPGAAYSAAWLSF